MLKHFKQTTKNVSDYYKYLKDQLEQEQVQQLETQRTGVPFGYYVGGEELASHPTAFIGALAAEWGLGDSRVTEEHFLNLADGANAVTGEPLLKASHGSKVKMHEVVFSAPKGLSLALAVADADQLEEIVATYRDSMAEVVKYMESTLPLVRRRVDGEEIHERASGLIAMSFEHLTARPAKDAVEAGLPISPDWHNHLNISNVVARQPDKLAADGSRYGALESSKLENEQKLLDSLWQLGVKDKLEALGYRTDTSREVEQRLSEITGKPVEHSKNREIFIHGITSRDLTLFWSPRTVEISRSKKRQLDQFGVESLDELPSHMRRKVNCKASLGERMAKQKLTPEIVDDWKRLLAEGNTDPELGPLLPSITAATLARAKELGPRDRSKLTKVFITRMALARTPEIKSVVKWSQLRGLLGEECLSYGTSRQMCLELTDSVWQIEETLEAAATIGRKIDRELAKKKRKLTDAEIEGLRVDQKKKQAEGEALARAFSPSLAVLGANLVTTTQQLASEQAVVSAVGTWAAAPLPAPAAKWAQSPQALAVIARDALINDPEITSLSADQVAAIRAILRTRVAVVKGESGTGKTAVTRVIAHSWVREVPAAQVIALAVSKKRVTQFGAETGADRSFSFEGLKSAVKNGSVQIDDKTLILVDELAQVDTKRLSMLVKAVGKATPGFVGVGDPTQLASLGAGRLWDECRIASGVEIPPITKIQRTKDPVYGKVWKAMRDPKKIQAAVAWLGKENLVTCVPDREAAIEAALDRWEESRAKAAKDHGKDVAAEARIITGLSNATVDDISRRAQLRLLAAGQLKGEPVQVSWIDPQNPNYQREFDIYKGDLVQITANFTVTSGGKRIEFSNGDIVRIAKAQHGTAGATARVEVELLGKAGNPIVELAKPKQLEALRLQYCGHDFKIQGDSILADPVMLDSPNTTLESAYMANSRGKGWARTHTVVALDEIVPDLDEQLADLRTEQKKALKALGKGKEPTATVVARIAKHGQSEEEFIQKVALEGLTKRWQRTVEDIPAITLARQQGILPVAAPTRTISPMTPEMGMEPERDLELRQAA